MKIIYFLSIFFLSGVVSPLAAQDLIKGSVAYYESLSLTYQTKIDWVQNNPAEHALAIKNNWYEMATRNVEQIKAYKLLAEQSSNHIFIPDCYKSKEDEPEDWGSTCETSIPLCSEYEYDRPCGFNEGLAELGPDYGCITSQPNPVWHYFQIENSGNIILELSAPLDVDYIIWGPFSEVTCDYEDLSAVNIVDCGYSSNNIETPEIGVGSSEGPTTAVEGEFYMLMIVNFSNQEQDFSLLQIGGEGDFPCNFWPTIDLTLNIGDCEPHQTDSSYYSEYDITGNVSYTDIFSLDSVVFVLDDSIFQVSTFNLSSPINFTLNNHLADGDWHYLDALFYYGGGQALGASESFTTINCATCEANAGPDIMGNVLITEASIDPPDYNTSWQALCDEIVFSNDHIVDSEVSFVGVLTDTVSCDLVWTITNYLNLTCSDTISATFIPLPEEPEFIDSTTIVCSEDSTFLSVVNNPYYTYHWDLPEGWLGQSDSSSIVVYNDGTEGFVIVTAESEYGMGSPHNLEISILDYPLVDFSYTFTETVLSLTNNSQSASSYLWNFGDSTISNEIDPVHQYTVNGTYLVKLFAENFCGLDSNVTSILVNGIGIEERDYEKLKLYPNPSNGTVIISGLKMGDNDIEVLDITGRVVMNIQIVNMESLQLDLSNLKDGVYQLILNKEFYETIVLRNKFSN